MRLLKDDIMENKPNSSMRSVERALGILSLFADVEDELNVQDICRALDMPRSTCFRLLKCFVDARFVERTEYGYVLGDMARKLGGQPRQHKYLLRLFSHRLRELSEKSFKTVNLNVLHSNNYRLCIAQVHSSHQSIRHYTPLNVPLPLYAGSAGKCIWAHLPTELREEIYTTNANKISLSKKEQFAELDMFREQGYSASRGERLKEAGSVSIPIFSSEGAPLGSLTMSAILSDFPMSDIPLCVAMLRQLRHDVLPYGTAP